MNTIKHGIQLFTALAAFALAANATAQWTQHNPATVPVARGQQAMTYDWNRQNTVMFGGFSRSAGLTGHADTWTFDGSDWTEMFPATSPAYRARSRMVYDLRRSVAVLYGGAGAVSLSTTTSPIPVGRETWEWDGSNWTNVAPANNPGDRRSHGMAYDINRGRVVLHGGIKSGLGAERDTWEYDGQNWRRTVVSAGPGPRAGSAMCYHVGLGKTVLFGGVNPFTGGFNDTWTYDGTSWAELAISGPLPSPREDARMVYDTNRNVCVLFGGLLSVSPFTTILGDTWEFDGTSWTQVSDSVPSSRVYVGMAMDVVRNRIVAFGGLTSAIQLTASDETWELSGYFRTFGTGCQGSNGVPALSSASIPRLLSPLTIDLSSLATASGIAALGLGGSDTIWAGIPLPADMSPFGYTGCTLYASLDLTFPLAVSGAGTASWTWNVPDDEAFLGLELFSQALSVDLPANPGGLVFSNAGSAVFGQ